LLGASLALIGNIGLMVGLALCPDPVTVAVAQLLTIPATGISEYLLWKVDFSHLAIGGSCLILLAFITVLGEDVRAARGQAAVSRP